MLRGTMRALLAVLLLTGLATTYSQDLEWFAVGPHQMSEVYWNENGCWQDAVFNLTAEDEFLLAFLKRYVSTHVEVQVVNLNEQFWEGYGYEEWIPANDNSKVQLIPPAEMYGQTDRLHILRLTTGQENTSIAVPVATLEDRILYVRQPELTPAVFSFEFYGENGRVLRKSARISEVFAVFREQFVPKCLGGSSAVSTPFPSATADSTRSATGGLTDNSSGGGSVVPPRNVQRTIQDHCKNEWPSDKEMRDYCSGQQRDSVRVLEALIRTNGDIPSKEFSMIYNDCEGQWPGDFRMHLYCLEKQIEAYNVLHGRGVNVSGARPTTSQSNSVDKLCKAEWPGDFEMQAYCQEQQLEGIRYLASVPTGVSRASWASALRSCRQDWPDDFRMQAYCAKNEVE